jgi:hypothetical protein
MLMMLMMLIASIVVSQGTPGGAGQRLHVFVFLSASIIVTTAKQQLRIKQLKIQYRRRPAQAPAPPLRSEALQVEISYQKATCATARHSGSRTDLALCAVAQAGHVRREGLLACL